MSLCLDSLGRPHVAYSKRRSLFYNMLKYAWRGSTGWNPEFVDSLGGTDCVLRFDRLGRLCVAHCASWSSGGLYYSTRTETGWLKDTLLADNASQCCMTLDEAGQPHISYFWASGGAYDLRYAERAGDTWRFDVVDHGQQLNKRGSDNCIVRDRAGTYHLSYHAHNELQLRYARGRLGSWNVEVVDTVGGWNLCSSIDLDELGRAYVAYCDENEGGALYLASQADLTGVEEMPNVEVRTSNSGPTIVRGVLRLRDCHPVSDKETGGCTQPVLLDATGRKVLDLQPGANDVSGLAPGVYFVRSRPSAVSREPSVVGRVIVTR